MRLMQSTWQLFCGPQEQKQAWNSEPFSGSTSQPSLLSSISNRHCVGWLWRTAVISCFVFRYLGKKLSWEQRQLTQVSRGRKKLCIFGFKRSRGASKHSFPQLIINFSLSTHWHNVQSNGEMCSVQRHLGRTVEWTSREICQYMLSGLTHWKYTVASLRVKRFVCEVIKPSTKLSCWESVCSCIEKAVLFNHCLMLTSLLCCVWQNKLHHTVTQPSLTTALSWCLRCNLGVNTYTTRYMLHLSRARAETRCEHHPTNMRSDTEV